MGRVSFGGVQLGSLLLCCGALCLPPPVRGWASGACAQHPKPWGSGLVFPAGSRADTRAGSQEARRACRARGGSPGEGSGLSVPGVLPPPRRVSRPREACLASRGSQIRGQGTRKQVSQPRRPASGRVSPLCRAGGGGGSRGGGQPYWDTSTAFPRPFLLGSRRARRSRGSGVRRGQGAAQEPPPGARALAAAAPRPHPAGLRSPCPGSGTFIGRRRPRSLAARWFATLASPTQGPGSLLHFRVPLLGPRSLGSKYPGWMWRPRHPGQPWEREEEQEREEEVAAGAGKRRSRARRVTPAQPAPSDIHARLAASTRAEALIPGVADSAPAGGTRCSGPLSPRARRSVSGVFFLGDRVPSPPGCRGEWTPSDPG